MTDEDLHASDDPTLEDAFAQLLADEPEPGSPETPAAPTSPDAATETPPATDPSETARSDGRDALGRFLSKDGTAADSLDAPSANAAQDAQPTPGTPEPVAADAAPTDAAPQPLDDTVYEPFVVRVGHETHAIPGAVITPHGAVIPLDAIQQVHTLMGRGLKYEAERDQIKRAKLEVDQARAQHQAEIAPVMQEIDQLFGLFRNLAGAPDQATQEQAASALLEYALQFAQNEPLLKDRMKFERERAEFELTRRAQEPDPEQAADQLRQQTQTTVQETVAAYRQTEHGRHLTDHDWQTLSQRVDAEPTRYLYRVGPQPTAEERQAGCVPGEIVFNERAFQNDVLLLSQVRREAAANEAKHRQALDAVRKAQDENAKRLAAPKVGAVASKPKPAPKPVAADDSDDDAERKRLHAEFEAMLG